MAELVAFPSVASHDPQPPEACVAAADWVVRAFAAEGLQDVQAAPTPDGSLAVHGHAPGPPGALTVLLYSHYDVQPPLGDAQWRSPVWTLTERDGRWYGRGAADCKGNVVMHLTALRALREAAGGFPCAIKVVCEGSEEIGTGGLEAFVVERPDVLRADTILIADAGNFAVGVPTLTTSLRGMAMVDVRVEALASAVHSGSFGGPAPDPVAGLLRMLASLHDDAGTPVVDGLPDAPPWEGVEYPEERYRADATVLDGVGLIGAGSIAERLWSRPAVTVIGLDVPPIEGDRLRAAPRRRPGEPAGAAGDGRRRGPGGADRAPAAARPVGPSLHHRAGGGRRRLVHRRGRAGDGGDARGARGRLRARGDDPGPGRLAALVHRARRELSGRRDTDLRRRGAALPDPRAERERRPFRDRADRARRGALAEPPG